jgi:autotransporter-associated beta strand protein
MFGLNARVFGADILKANNTDDLFLTTSWIGGAAPGSADVAVWDNNVTSANQSNLGTSSTWGGIKILDPGGTVGIRPTGGRTLTLNGNIDASGATQDVNLAQNAFRIASTNFSPQFSIAASKTMTLGSGASLSNQGNTKTLTLVGPGSFVFDGTAGSGGAMSFNVSGAASVFMNNASNGWVGGTVTSGSLILGNATAMSGKRVTLNATNSLGFATSVTTADLGGLEGSGSFSLTNSATSPVALTIGSNNTSYTFSGSISGSGSLTKVGTGIQTLSGINTFTGNTLVTAGSILLADNAGLRFTIGPNGVSNVVGGNGSATFDGDFTFDLTSAGTTIGDSWSVVDVGTLNATFGSTFTPQSALGAFSDLGGGIWEIAENAATYQFSTSSGTLQVVPEPAVFGALLAGMGLLGLIARTRRKG